MDMRDGKAAVRQNSGDQEASMAAKWVALGTHNCDPVCPCAIDESLDPAFEGDSAFQLLVADPTRFVIAGRIWSASAEFGAEKDVRDS